MTLRPSRAVLLHALVFATVSSSAAAQQVDLPGTQPGGLAGRTELAPAADCATCHGLGDSSAQGFMSHDTWRGTLMAQAARDPLFLAALSVAEQDVPGVGDYCLRCHSPSGFLGGRTRGSAEARRGDRLTGTDLDGVHCDVCHRMVPGVQPARNAQYTFAPGEDRFGPYADAASMRHGNVQSAFPASADLCTTCHVVTHPGWPLRDVDGGVVAAEFPLDTTGTEWSQSVFARPGPSARTCQDCHMPRADDARFVSMSISAVPRTGAHSHAFVGGNAWMLHVLAGATPDAGLAPSDPGSAEFLERTAQRTEAFLRTAATLAITDVAPGPQGALTITARITNRTGHKLPTGYADGRRVWLRVVLEDAAGRRFPVSGSHDPATGALTPDAQLRVYEAVHGRAGLGPEEHLALHDLVVKDTRLPPEGMVADPSTRPVGAAFDADGGVLRHWDDARYTFMVPASAVPPVTVRVQALWQATTPEYVHFLEQENRTDDRGRTLRALWEASGRAPPVLLAEATREIVPAAPDAGILADTGVDAAPGIDAGAPSASPRCNCRVGAGADAPRAPWLAGVLVVLARAARRRRRRA